MNFFTEFLGGHLKIAWNFMVPLLKLGFPKEKGGARTEFQREIAMKLVTRIVKRTAKCEDSAIFEKVLKKHEKVCKLAREALDVKTWKNPVKYWQQYLTFCMTLAKALNKRGLLSVNIESIYYEIEFRMSNSIEKQSR